MTSDEAEALHAEAIILYSNMMYSHLRLVRDESDYDEGSDEVRESRAQYIQNLTSWQRARDAVNMTRTRRP